MCPHILHEIALKWNLGHLTPEESLDSDPQTYGPWLSLPIPTPNLDPHEVYTVSAWFMVHMHAHLKTMMIHEATTADIRTKLNEE